MEDLGAEPGGRVLAWNSGAASLPTGRPGWCYDGVRGLNIGGDGMEGNTYA